MQFRKYRPSRRLLHMLTLLLSGLGAVGVVMLMNRGLPDLGTATAWPLYMAALFMLLSGIAWRRRAQSSDEILPDPAEAQTGSAGDAVCNPTDSWSASTELAEFRRVADNIEAESRSAVEQLTSVTDGMGQSTHRLVQASIALSQEAASASQSASEACNHSQTAAEGADSITATIESIDRSAADVACAVAEATASAEVSVATISSLSAQTESITEVVSLIEEIASQTTMLALNAMIEAARAGEAGAGFSVVADEVKSLATRTINATSKVREAVQGVQAGVSSASTAIMSVTAHVTTVEEASRDISARAAEQKSLIEQVAQDTLASLDASTKSRALIETASRSAEASREMATCVGETTRCVCTEANDLHSKLTRIVRTSSQGADRRRHPRHQVALLGHWSSEAHEGGMLLFGNISRGGALVNGGLGKLTVGAPLRIEAAAVQLPPTAARVVGFSHHGVRLQFDEPLEQSTIDQVLSGAADDQQAA